MDTPRILIVDDETNHRAMLRINLRGWGYATDEAEDGDIAVEKVRAAPYGAVLCDIRMVRMDGLAALEAMLQLRPDLPVLIMTAYSSLDTVKKALRLGACDYFTKPLDMEEIRDKLAEILTRKQAAAAPTSPDAPPPSGLLGASACMAELITMLQTVAPSEATVLITGESGTGKELVARAIQQASLRADKPFVTVNCAALSPSLLESELFGHEKGAFTGADKRREGRFRQADGGTLFLDEIGELPVLLQAKLLRALQQGEVQRVGSDLPLRVDVRVIAATNRDLRAEVAAGHFREDLFYRLNVIGIEVPPLRQRREDIPVLANAFLLRFAAANRKSLRGFSSQAMDALMRYPWPGNVRELENVVERAVILCTGDQVSERELPTALRETPPDLPLSAPSPAVSLASPAPSASPAAPGAPAVSPAASPPADSAPALPHDLAGLTLDEIERRAILATLHEVADNKSEAARRLGITRATLHNKLKRYGEDV